MAGMSYALWIVSAEGEAVQSEVETRAKRESRQHRSGRRPAWKWRKRGNYMWARDMHPRAEKPSKVRNARVAWCYPTKRGWKVRCPVAWGRYAALIGRGSEARRKAEIMAEVMQMVHADQLAEIMR